MWTDQTNTGGSGRSQNQGQHDPNRGRLTAAALGIALTVFLTSWLPGPLIAPVVSEILLFAAFGTSIIAGLRGEVVFADQITGWDQAALMLFVSLLAGFFVDPEAVAALVEQMSAASEAGG